MNVEMQMYEIGDGTFTYGEIWSADPMSEDLEILKNLEVNESVSLGTSGYVKRIA